MDQIKAEMMLIILQEVQMGRINIGRSHAQCLDSFRITIKVGFSCFRIGRLPHVILGSKL